MNQPLFEELIGIVGAANVRASEPLATLTTFKIGGPADIFVSPASIEDVSRVVVACEHAREPWRVIGCGSDLLVAGAGATNAAVAEAACAAGLSGYEFACGIPGTLGGAAIMNAGAYDGEFSQVCASVTCVAPDGRVVEVPRSDAEWSYRGSMFDYARYIVVSATLELSRANEADVRARMDELTERREAKQPLDMPSAGSTFKRPEGYYAAALIDEAGLRGLTVGGAQVSRKHTGFVVNAGGATSADVRALIAEVQRRVREHSGVELSPEVRMWGRDA